MDDLDLGHDQGSLQPPELSSFLIEYYNDYKSSEMPQPWMILAGLASIGIGSFFTLQEYLEYKEEQKSKNEQKEG